MKFLIEPDRAEVRAIHKVEITNGIHGERGTEVQIPVTSKILHAEREKDPFKWSVWYETDVAKLDELTTVRFEWCNEGDYIGNKNAEYLCTQRAQSGGIMLHLYWCVIE